MLRSHRGRARLVAVGMAAVLAAVVLAPPAGSQTPPVAELRDIAATECRDDGVDVAGLLVLELPAGAQVDQVFRVVDGATTVELDTATTPMPGATSVTQPYADSIRFGGTWTAGLPFTYEIQISATVGGEVVADQTVEVPCTAAGTTATSGGAPGMAVTPAATATPVTGSPRFTG